ncbi:hypothetical protein [Burkholderia cepacia]|uniref:hypothetical protein n=1 Tax=Burkholderia cepacia TaxID=292 RepID=UPI0012D9F308|nr:hypothetical protein [Burkholderia cepacia]
MLYPSLRCELPIENARNLRKAEILYGNQLVDSCWGMVLSPLKDQFVFVTKYGNTDSGSIVGYTKVKILGDGSARVIGPAISASEYQKRVDDYQRATR